MTADHVTIREVRVDDIEALLALWRVTESGPSVTDTPAHLRMLVEQAPDLFLAAELDGRIVGSVLGGWDLWRGHIYRLAVHPECSAAAWRGGWWRRSRAGCGHAAPCASTRWPCREMPRRRSGARSLTRSPRTSR